VSEHDVTTVETQVHGYKQGHQLLSATIGLSKADQAVVDRLSDVAGPLRPGESFAPYLSAYPLPSGDFYVLSRTWQDLSVERAGCVRTLSLIVPLLQWANAPDLTQFFRLLDQSTPPLSAERLSLDDAAPALLPPLPNLRAGELLEALFLEYPQPVAIFDAPRSEIIAARLLTALWPSFRQRFSVATFALSPRKIEGRFFDLMFAPLHARSRFAECRRIDAKGGQEARHRWTSTIEHRVFSDPQPRLLDPSQLRLLGTEDADSPAALRVALLWDELLTKLDRAPTAALGLIDIAKSRMDGGPHTLQPFIPALERAIHRATMELPTGEAWDFLDAIARKLAGTKFPNINRSVSQSVESLAAKEPNGALEVVERNVRSGSETDLTAAIGRGFAAKPSELVDVAMENATVEAFACLADSDNGLARAISIRPRLLRRLTNILSEVDESTFVALRNRYLPLLTEDWQIDAARQMLATLDAAQLQKEVDHLARLTDLAAESFIEPIVERARQLNVIGALRNTLLLQHKSPGRDRFVQATLTLADEDIEWVLSDNRFSALEIQECLVGLLSKASQGDWLRLASNHELSHELAQILPIDNPQLIYQLIAQPRLALPAYTVALFRLFAVAPSDQRAELARKALRRCLGEHFPGNDGAAISDLLGAIGSHLDGVQAAQVGLSRRISYSVLSRNLVAFNRTAEPARQKLIAAIREVADVLTERFQLEVDEPAANACASMLLEAERQDYDAFLQASAKLLPVLMRSRRSPVSAIVAIAFPPVYRELAKDIEVPDLFRFVPFMDWDRCKAARNELVSTFIASDVWKPTDLVIAACLSRDLEHILNRLRDTYRGEEYLLRIASMRDALPADCASQFTRFLERHLKRRRHNRGC
jgi:hypothetical protein